MLVNDSDGNSALASYALGSIACFFFSNAVILQMFEWQLLAAMISFQAEHRVVKLNVVKEDYNRSECKKVRWACYAIWFNLIYHLAKASIPSSTLI